MTVSVRFSDDHRVSIAQLRRVIRRQGFDPREATPTVRGKVVVVDEVLRLRVPGLDEVFEVAGDDPVLARLRRAAGSDVVVGVLGDVPGVHGLRRRSRPRARTSRGRDGEVRQAREDEASLKA